MYVNNKTKVVGVATKGSKKPSLISVSIPVSFQHIVNNNDYID